MKRIRNDTNYEHRLPFRMLLVCLLSGVLVGALQAQEANRGPDDPYYHSKGTWGQDFDDQWALKSIGFARDEDGNSVWDDSAKASRPVVVALIDTGLDYFHPDLDRKNLWKNTAEITNGKDDDNNGFVDDLIGWNFVDNNNNPWDKTGHGTHTAGIIAATIGNGEGISGINPVVQIMPLKVMNFLGRGNSSAIAEAIFYAVNNGARVINLSIGGEFITRIEQEAISYANRRGILVVVASGNTASDTSDYGFAKLKSVITVAATGLDDKRAPFSNWGQDVNISAPGVEVLSLRARRTDFILISGAENYEPGTVFVGPENKYYRASGSSFAAPFVSGVASLLFALQPDLTSDQVTRMILMSARDIEIPGWDQLTGYGILDARSAIAADPDYFAFAKITSITPIQTGGSLVIQVKGTAASSEFREAWLELGFGEKPTEWKIVGTKIATSITDGVLSEITPNDFDKRGKWTVRVMLKTKRDGMKEAWGSLDIQ